MASCGAGGGPDLCPDIEQTQGILLDLLPRGRAWDAARRPSTVLWRFWRAVAHLYYFANERICAAAREAYCSTVLETRDMWMLEYGLPDACDPFPDLCAKVGAIGGARCEYYQQVAARAGWAVSCENVEGDCGAKAGCAQPGCAQPGGLRSAALLRIVVDLDASPAYARLTYPPPQAGALKAGHRLGCPPEVSTLLCLMDRVIHAHVEVDYRFTGSI